MKRNRLTRVLLITSIGLLFSVPQTELRAFYEDPFSTDPFQSTTPVMEQNKNMNTSTNTNTPKEPTDEILYTVTKPNSFGHININSAEEYSPEHLGHDWIVFDHVGYKDTAFQGERHIAYDKNSGGLHFFGYDAEPLTDAVLKKFNNTGTQTISTLQAPVRADWHTLDGNGILFGIEEVSDNITGYSVVYTTDEMQIREYTNAPIDKLGLEGNYTVLVREPKECPAMEATVNITGNKAVIEVGGKSYSIEMKTSGRNAGIVVSYAEHSCESLSSVYAYSFIVDGKEYLMK